MFAECFCKCSFKIVIYNVKFPHIHPDQMEHGRFYVCANMQNLKIKHILLCMNDQNNHTKNLFAGFLCKTI